MRSVFLWRIVTFIIYSFARYVSASSDDNDVKESEEDEERTGTIIGIDLGTTYSECSFLCSGTLLLVITFQLYIIEAHANNTSYAHFPLHNT